MTDSFAVPLTLDFDPAAHAVTARLDAPLAHRGACAVAGGVGAGAPSGGIMAMVAAAIALARRRARREV
jgi:hypothetical protein